MDRGATEKRDQVPAAATALAIVNVPHMLFQTGKLNNSALRASMDEEVVKAALLWLGGKCSAPQQRLPRRVKTR